MFRGPLSLVKGLPAGVRLLVFGTLVNKTGTFIIPYLSIVLAREFGLTPSQIGRLLLGYGVGSLVSILVGGFLTDFMGRRRTLIVSLLGSGALAVSMAFARSLPAFATLLVLFGFVADLYRPASSAIISDLLPSRMRAVGYAAIRMAINLGFAVGMVLGGAIADLDWRWLFIGDGGTTLAFGLVVYAFVAETKPARAPLAAAHSAVASGPWRDSVFLLTCLSSFLYSQVFFLDFTVLPLTITSRAGYPPIVYGLLVGLNGLLVALFEMSIVDRLRPFRRLRTTAVGVLVMCVGVALTGFVMHWAWFLLVILLWTAGEILALPQQMSFVADWAPPEARGRYLSVYGATWSLAMAVSPAFFLPLHDRLPEPLFWMLVSLIALPSALIALRLDRIADRPERLRGWSDSEHHDEAAAEAALVPALSPEA